MFSPFCSLVLSVRSFVVKFRKVINIVGLQYRDISTDLFVLSTTLIFIYLSDAIDMYHGKTRSSNV